MYNMIQENKINKKKGFTLAELLVVVAIIAVLVAISIPIFTSQLDKAKKSTDLANVRAAKAAAVTQYLSDESTGAATYMYDANNGKIVTSAPSGYNKLTGTKLGETTNGTGDDSTTAADSAYVKIDIAANGTTTTATWVTK